jgi:hypothetical protein
MLTMTNREWLASLSDKELAIWLCQISNCTYCEFIKYCSREGKGASEWLKQERKECDSDDKQTMADMAVD